MEFAVVNENESKQRPYPYVYVLRDGSVRELTKDEREYLETPFHPADGARPYVKNGYYSKDGWGSIQGFCARYQIPTNITIKE